MGREKLQNYDFITITEFINDYVLSVIGDNRLTGNQKAQMVNMSHLDLDELNLPGVKRIGDADALHYSMSDVILVGAKGRNHRGFEVHGYLRPFNVLKKELKEQGYTEEEIINILITKKQDYDFCEIKNEKIRRRKKND